MILDRTILTHLDLGLLCLTAKWRMSVDFIVGHLVRLFEIYKIYPNSAVST